LTDRERPAFNGYGDILSQSSAVPQTKVRMFIEDPAMLANHTEEAGSEPVARTGDLPGPAIDTVGGREMTVALGPSLAARADAVQRSLGGAYHVVGVLDPPERRESRSEEPGDIAILATPELPDGQMLVRERGSHGVIVIGMPTNRRWSAAPESLPDDVLAAIRALSARIHRHLL
jgi:hypothetical protein